MTSKAVIPYDISAIGIGNNSLFIAKIIDNNGPMMKLIEMSTFIFGDLSLFSLFDLSEVICSTMFWLCSTIYLI